MNTPSMRKRRFAISLNVLVQIIVVLLLVGAANWIVARHYLRFDWTKAGYYRLSDKTRQLLASLPAPVDVIVYLPPRAGYDAGEKTLQDVRSLLDDMQFVSKGNLRVEYVDPDRQRARAEMLAEKYKFDEPNVIIFVAGDRHKFVTLRDVVEFDFDRFSPGPPRVKAFKGEGVFLSTLQSITHEEPATVYFLTGRGERDPDSFDPRAGYSTLAAYIKRDFITIEKWNLLEQHALPTNAAALVIAGPRRPYSDAELDALDQYLKDGGRLLVMLDARQPAGLEPLLQRWGVLADNNIVMRRAGALLGTELLDVNAVVATYAPHPVTAGLAGTNTEFPYARSVRRAPQTSDQPRVTELLMTSAAYWGEAGESERAEFDPATDLAGPISLAVAVEAGQPRGVDVDLGVTRMVVVGSSSFADNSSLTEGNLDFFMNALNWLLRREQVLAVGPKTPREFRLDMSRQQMRAVTLLTLVGLPLAVGVIGLSVWLKRRR